MLIQFAENIKMKVTGKWKLEQNMKNVKVDLTHLLRMKP
jgi:hypothetical protein